MAERYSLAQKRVWVAGHRGLVGSAIVRRLAGEGCEVITVDHDRLDLTDQSATRTWIKDYRPQVIVLAAGRVGGILANQARPASFLYENLMIEANVVHAAYEFEAEKLLMLGSTCIYPRLAAQPIREEALLGGPLEPTNEAYAVAKIAGLKLAEAYRAQYGCDFISAMPTNLYGPQDNFDLGTAHVLPALLRKAHEAKLSDSAELVVWGTGMPQREFLHVDDCADALVFLLKNYSAAAHVNVGSGSDLSIRELAEAICAVVDFKGELVFDTTKPDGMPRKLTDVSRLTTLGWAPKISLSSGLRQTYNWFCSVASQYAEAPSKVPAGYELNATYLES